MKLEIGKSMEDELLIQADDLGVEPGMLVEAILLAFFCHNNKGLEIIYSKAKSKKGN